MTCLRYCYETRIVRNTGTPAALCLTLVWSRNQIRLGIATLQFCNDGNGAGRTASCHKRLSGSGNGISCHQILEPTSHPRSHPRSHPTSHPTSILPSFSHQQTNRAFGYQAGLHRNGRHWDEIEHFQEENTRGAEGHLKLSGWWYLLTKTPGRSLHKRQFDILIPSFERMIVCREREND